jgi:hypothetical protein
MKRAFLWKKAARNRLGGVQLALIASFSVAYSGMTTLARGDDIPRGIILREHGTTVLNEGCFAAGCTGDLVTCQAGEVMAISKSILSHLERVCDDSGTTPCAGKITGVAESCYVPGADTQLAGTMLSTTVRRGQFRTCFDNTAQADCTGAAASSLVISSGIFQTHIRQSLFDGPLGQSTNEFRATDTRPFQFGGRMTRLHRGMFLLHVTFQPNPIGDPTCETINPGGTPGCGFAATGVAP